MIDGQNYHIFMEYASGGELFDRIGIKINFAIDKFLVPDIGMPVEDARRYFIQLMSGLKYLHALGICHRDIKPENLLLTSDGNFFLNVHIF